MAAAPVRTLNPGTPVERELAAGESHTWSVELAAGQPWRVAVEQRGIDVVVAVSAADGKRLTVDAPLDRQGTETVLVEPAAAGIYLVEVRAQEPAAPSGRYEIWIDAADQRRLAALRAVTRAGERYLEGTAEARRQAIAEQRQALEAWRDLGDRREEARSLYALSVLSRLVNDTRQALALGQEALPLWQALGDRLWEASTWNETGLDHWLLGESAAGRQAFEKALAIQREIGDRYGEGASLSNLCLMDLSRGELRAGAACYEGALPVLREVKAAALEGMALLSVGRAYDVLGEPEQALDRYQQALGQAQARGDRGGEARTLNHLGLLYQELGEYQEALTRFGQALDVFQSLGERRWQATVLHNMGLVDQSVGEWPRAASYYEQALRLWREVGDPREEASTLTSLGQVRNSMKNPKEALALHQRALAINRTLGDRWREGVSQVQLGRTYLAMGDFPTALAALDRAVELLGATGALADQADALDIRGEVQTRLGDPRKGLESLRQALELARTTGHRAIEAHVELRLARAERGLGHLEQARAHGEAALAILESLRTRIGSPDLRASFSAFTHETYELQIDLLMAAGQGRLALEVTERARARTLLELLSEAGVDIHQGVPAALLERRTSLLRRLSVKVERALRERPGTADRREALEEDRFAILRDLDVVEAEIRERSPGYAALIQPQPLSAAGMQALLDPDTLLLSYSLGQDRSFLWAMTATTLDSFVLPARAEVEQAARQLHQDLSAFDPAARGREAEDAAALGRMLLGPVADRLAGGRLVVVPDGALEYVPFGALPVPGGAETVVERHEVVYLPSASALAVQRRVLEHRPPAPKQLAVLADPVFDPSDPRVSGFRGNAGGKKTEGSRESVRSASAAPVFERLPGSRLEAEAIAGLAQPGQSRVALDFDASRSQALGDGLAGFRTVHFATHGVIDAEHPALSGLALSMVDRDGRSQEGFLHLHDIYNLRLNADLVVLSGCRTALGKEVRGEGLIGLTRGFLYAGTPRVLASLWRVEDHATAALMTRFYRALWIDGLRPAAALRAAQLSLRGERRWRDPYYWAGFVLEGDWN